MSRQSEIDEKEYYAAAANLKTATTEEKIAETEGYVAANRLRVAKLNGQPHKIYGARVWRTELRQESERWACGIVQDNSFILYCGTIETRGEPYGTSAHPVAFGQTPKEACANFDRLWDYGEYPGQGEETSDE